MICEHCNTEHPASEIANPHYCIARLEEQLEKKDIEIDTLSRTVAERDTVLEAWHSVFGTTQLTHAQARLEQAEKSVAQQEREIAAQMLTINQLEEFNQQRIFDIQKKDREIAALGGRARELEDAAKQALYLIDPGISKEHERIYALLQNSIIRATPTRSRKIAVQHML
jgi:hypothetical protein